jgi:hypothetical protein
MVNTIRRSYLKSFLSEALSIVEEFRGRPQLLLDDLETVPEDVLRDMVPVFNSGKPSKIEDGWLAVQERKNGEFKQYRELQGHEEYILACFDGNHSISGICNCLEADFQLDQEAAFSVVKGLFVQLARAAICHPAGGPS